MAEPGHTTNSRCFSLARSISARKRGSPRSGARKGSISDQKRWSMEPRSIEFANHPSASSVAPTRVRQSASHQESSLSLRAYVAIASDVAISETAARSERSAAM